MINTKALLKAMGYMFLPSFAILFVIFIGFFNWSNFVAFVTSQDGWAIFMRIAMLIAEIVLVTWLYFDFLKDENQKLAFEKAKNPEFLTKVREGTRDYSVTLNTDLFGGERINWKIYKGPNRNTFIVTTEKYID
jgi:hypothetical protein